MELGSEFSLSLSNLSTVENNTIELINQSGMEGVYFDSGRSALRFLLNNLNIEGTYLLPEYICESVIECFPTNKVRFYRVSDSFVADVDDIKEKTDLQTGIIYVMHYYGMLQPLSVLEKIQEIAHERDITIVEDITHSIFTSLKTIGDYVIGSLRKWMPIPDGGLLLSNKHFDLTSLEKQLDNSKIYGMILKQLYLEKKLDCNSHYRQLFIESEQRLDRQKRILAISDLSLFLLKCVDSHNLVEQRKHNYSYLKKLLLEQGISPAVELGDNCCPFAFPIRIHNRDCFREYMIDNSIYCAVHWPRDGIRERERKQAVNNATSLISLPIDQRYGRKHMEYMADVISHYGGVKQS